jgi:preprotein translocase subunit SecG
MQHVIIVIHLMLVLALIGVVLLQRSEGGGLGVGGGGGGFMSSRGTANVLTRATAILAGLFFCTSLILSILAGYSRKPTSILGGTAAPVSAPAVPGSTPPAGGSSGGGVLDALKGAPAAPTAPAAPSGPQVPQSK